MMDATSNDDQQGTSRTRQELAANVEMSSSGRVADQGTHDAQPEELTDISSSGAGNQGTLDVQPEDTTHISDSGAGNQGTLHDVQPEDTTHISDSGAGNQGTLDVQPEELASSSYDIGPFSQEAGISRRHFAVDGPSFPIQEQIKNGLVVELNNFVTSEIGMSKSKLASMLIEITGTEDAKQMSVLTFVKRVVDKYKLLRRKGQACQGRLHQFMEEPFLLVRTRQMKEVDTPRKKNLRKSLAEARSGAKGVKRKLADTKSRVLELESELAQQKGTSESLEEAHTKSTASQVEVNDLTSNLHQLQEQHNTLLLKMEEITAQFDPAVNELQIYKEKYNESSGQLNDIEQKWKIAQEKLAKMGVRNVNKRIKRRDENISKLTAEKSKLQEVVEELNEDLATTKAQLTLSTSICKKLTKEVKQKSQASNKMYKKAWYHKKHTKASTSTSYSTDDLPLHIEQSKYLNKRKHELEGLISLFEDDVVTTFQEGKYTDTVRRTIMALLAQNVSMNKVNDVIKIVLKNFAGKDVQRLPSAGTRSKLAIEANHLAIIEVAKAMNSTTPEATLGNCIHGDGTTKHHKKYQNFQVSLPDGTSRTLALVEMAAGDTDAVTEAFTEHINELASTLRTLEKEPKSQSEYFNELITTIKSTMTDQGPTMPQFNERLQAIRSNLLPQVVNNWDEMPEAAKSCMKEFGSFYCKMHPLINFAEEISKVLKSFEDISKSGKNIQTSEAGVTRLVRIASKALHHRGCDKSGVEDVFTAYLRNAHGLKNNLVDYIGNRANILFEGAAALYFHLDHILSFFCMLENKNNLLQAVEEDAKEMIYKAELRALGLFYGLVTRPLWNLVKQADNILAMNQPLHQLQQKLIQWKEDASPMLTGDSPFEVDLSSDSICKKLLVPTKADSECVTVQALELCSCAMLLILQRQCKDQLPGGKYWDPSHTVTSAFANVPSTNLIGERDFAQLDLLVRQKPAARVATLETIIMWTNNKTTEWLDNLPEEDRAKYMAMARQRSSDVLDRYKKRKATLMAQKWENLQKAQEKKKNAEEKKMRTSASLVNDVATLGGLWTTTDSIKENITKLEQTKNDEFIRRAIHTQLTFLQKVLKCKGPSKTHYQLSHQQQQFTKTEMTKHLQEVVLHHKLQPQGDPHVLVKPIK